MTIFYNVGGISFTSNATSGQPALTCSGAVGQFVVGGLAGKAANAPFTIQWCAIGDPSDWPTPGTTDARTKQAGSQVLSPRHGRITAIAGGDFFGYVFQERGITKMSYVGGDVVFSFDTFEEGRGCCDYGRITQADDLVFFQSSFGHHMLNADQVVDIGLGRVDKTYRPKIVQSVVDLYLNHTYTVATNSHYSTVIFSDNSLVYNYKTDQWSRVPGLAGHGFYSRYKDDRLIGVVRQTSSVGPFAFDLQERTTGTAAATVTFVTGEFSLNTDGRALVDSTRVISDGASISSVRLGTRNLTSDAVTWVTGSSVNTRTGRSHFRGGASPPDGRYHRAEFVFTGDFTTVSGADFDFTITGQD